MLTVGHERMLTVGHERMLTVGHERGCLQLGMREDAYSWA